LAALVSDRSWEVRRAAIVALGQSRDPGAVEALASALRDNDPDVREAAVTALGNVRDEQAIAPLVLALKDPSTQVRRCAQAALQRIHPHWEKTEAARSVLPELKAALQSQEYWVRHSAGKALEQIGEEAAASTVPREVPASDAGQFQRAAAMLILSDVLRDRDPHLRLAAAEALALIGDRRAVAALNLAMQDSDPFVQGAVIRALQAMS
jgi:HEAT repeat protein